VRRMPPPAASLSGRVTRRPYETIGAQMQIKVNKVLKRAPLQLQPPWPAGPEGVASALHGGT